jgi:serpin B
VMDFRNAFEEARETINEWVAWQTRDRIRDLLPAQSLNHLTRLVLTNAIYFQASWKEPFDPDRTEDAPFHLRDGTTAEVPMMRQHEVFPYAEVEGVQIVSLPYVGNEVSMLVLLPQAGGLDALIADLDHARFQAMVGALSHHRGPLALPRFGFESPLGLKDLLEKMGMVIPFDPFGANFHAMADLSLVDDMNLYISDVVHKAFVAVDEEGTEAAAATAVIVAAPDSEPGEPPFEMTVDRPFLFAIYDHPTETVLFLGRVLDPS